MLDDTLAVIMVGGSGARLWPLSRENFPKQFLDLTNSGLTLFQQSLLRARKIGKVLLIGNYNHRFIMLEQIRLLGFEDEIEKNITIIFEPCGKNTMPVAIISALFSKKHNFNKIILLPSDHLIKNEDIFFSSVSNAYNFLNLNDGIVTLGLTPIFPNIGYGYIKKSDVHIAFDVFKIEKFTEKPNEKTAIEYIKTGQYLWNSGIFIFNAEFALNESKNLSYEVYEQTKLAYENIEIKNDFSVLNEEIFSKINPNSIDYCLLEKTNNAFVIEAKNLDWNDLGSFDELDRIGKKDENGNILSDNVHKNNVKNCHIINKTEKPLVLSNLDNLLVVAMKDAIMIEKKGERQNIKKLIDSLKEKSIPQATNQVFDHRPWGSYENILEKDNFKIKIIKIKPKSELSYQLHKKRSEHWVIISGTAFVTLNDKEIELRKDESIYIPKNAKHKISNKSKTESIIFIEVQCGSYFGEDDIIRLDDKYGRN